MYRSVEGFVLTRAHKSLECMTTWPLLNKNKVIDSRVTEPVKLCTELDNAAVKEIAQKVRM
jgi:hypothetical protein